MQEDNLQPALLEDRVLVHPHVLPGCQSDGTAGEIQTMLSKGPRGLISQREWAPSMPPLLLGLRAIIWLQFCRMLVPSIAPAGGIQLPTTAGEMSKLSPLCPHLWSHQSLIPLSSNPHLQGSFTFVVLTTSLFYPAVSLDVVWGFQGLGWALCLSEGPWLLLFSLPR